MATEVSLGSRRRRLLHRADDRAVASCPRRRVQRLVGTLIMRCHSGLGGCIDGCVPAAAWLPSTARGCALQRPPPHNNLGWSVSRARTRCVGECIGLRCIAHERLALGVRVCTASLRWLPDPHRVRVADPREARCTVVCGRFVPHRAPHLRGTVRASSSDPFCCSTASTSPRPARASRDPFS